VPAIGLQELEHPLLRGAWFSCENVGNGVGKIVVAEENGVGATKRVSLNVRDRPRPDTGKGSE
jgi:hypothetical protein